MILKGCIRYCRSVYHTAPAPTTFDFPSLVRYFCSVLLKVLKSIQRHHSAESPRRMCSRSRRIVFYPIATVLAVSLLSFSDDRDFVVLWRQMNVLCLMQQQRPLSLALVTRTRCCTDFCHRGTTTQKLIFMGRELKERMHVMHFGPHYSPEKLS